MITAQELLDKQLDAILDEIGQIYKTRAIAERRLEVLANQYYRLKGAGLPQTTN